MSIFTQFRDEADFRERFIKPLLTKMGFFGIAHQHGSQEFGKDFVFSELHRLGGIRHYAAQVKHMLTINQGKMIDGLLSQVRQAFITPFRRADSPRECHVCAVYVFNSGEITANAKTQLLDELGRERYGDNVHFLDGDCLKSLSEYTSFHSDTEIRAKLTGLRWQLGLILDVIEKHAALEQGSPKEARGIIWAGLEELMTAPVRPLEPVMNEMYQLWQKLRIVQSCADQLGFVPWNETRRKDLATMKRLIPEATEHIMQITKTIDAVLASLQPLT